MSCHVGASNQSWVLGRTATALNSVVISLATMNIFAHLHFLVSFYDWQDGYTVKVNASKLDNLSPLPEAHMMERENQFPQVAPLPT